MDSWASSDGVRRSMRSNRRRDTKPELLVRRRLHAAGLRYRVDYKVEAGVRTRVDIAFTRARVVVFIDGCFWHGCPLHATTPKANSEYWTPKLTRNIARDRAADEGLRARGWTVLRYWEHESPDFVAKSIAEVVRRESQNN